MKYLIAVLLLVSSCATKPNASFILDKVYTYPEERNVLVAVPIIPVEIENISIY